MLQWFLGLTPQTGQHAVPYQVIFHYRYLEAWSLKLRNWRGFLLFLHDLFNIPGTYSSKDMSSLERMLDRAVVLVVKQKLGSEYCWMFPQTPWQPGETLRQVAISYLKLELYTGTLYVLYKIKLYFKVLIRTFDSILL